MFSNIAEKTLWLDLVVFAIILWSALGNNATVSTNGGKKKQHLTHPVLSLPLRIVSCVSNQLFMPEKRWITSHFLPLFDPLRSIIQIWEGRATPLLFSKFNKFVNGFWSNKTLQASPTGEMHPFYSCLLIKAIYKCNLCTLVSIWCSSILSSKTVYVITLLARGISGYSFYHQSK